MTPEQITGFAFTGSLIVGQLIQLLATRHAASKAAAEVKLRLDQQDVDAARAAAEVKRQLEIASADTLLRLEVIRIEGNSKMGAQKKKTWDFALMLALGSPEDHDRQAAARLAEKDYRDHQEAERVADDHIRLYVEAEKLRRLGIGPLTELPAGKAK